MYESSLFANVRVTSLLLRRARLAWTLAYFNAALSLPQCCIRSCEKPSKVTMTYHVLEGPSYFVVVQFGHCLLSLYFVHALAQRHYMLVVSSHISLFSFGGVLWQPT